MLVRSQPNSHRDEEPNRRRISSAASGGASQSVNRGDSMPKYRVILALLIAVLAAGPGVGTASATSDTECVRSVEVVIWTANRHRDLMRALAANPALAPSTGSVPPEEGDKTMPRAAVSTDGSKPRAELPPDGGGHPRRHGLGELGRGGERHLVRGRRGDAEAHHVPPARPRGDVASERVRPCHASTVRGRRPRSTTASPSRTPARP